MKNAGRKKSEKKRLRLVLMSCIGAKPVVI